MKNLTDQHDINTMFDSDAVNALTTGGEEILIETCNKLIEDCFIYGEQDVWGVEVRVEMYHIYKSIKEITSITEQFDFAHRNYQIDTLAKEQIENMFEGFNKKTLLESLEFMIETTIVYKYKQHRIAFNAEVNANVYYGCTLIRDIVQGYIPKAERSKQAKKAA